MKKYWVPIVLMVLWCLALLIGNSAVNGSELSWSIEGPRISGNLGATARVTYGAKSYEDVKIVPKDEPYKVWYSPGPHSLGTTAYKNVAGHFAYSRPYFSGYTGTQLDYFLVTARTGGLGVAYVHEDFTYADATAIGRAVVTNVGVLRPIDYSNVKVYIVRTELKFVATASGTKPNGYDFAFIFFGSEEGPSSLLRARYNKNKDQWFIEGHYTQYVSGTHIRVPVADIAKGWGGLNNYKKIHSHHSDIKSGCRYITVVNVSGSSYSVNRNNYIGEGWEDVLMDLGCEIRKIKVDVD